jgi:hypothetical protein
MAELPKSNEFVEQEPLLLRLVIVIGTPLVMFLLGIGLEIAAALSTQKQG